MITGPVVMVESVEYALVVSLLLVVVLVLARYAPERPNNVVNQPVSSRIYARNGATDTFSKAILPICNGDVYLVILIA